MQQSIVCCFAFMEIMFDRSKENASVWNQIDWQQKLSINLKDYSQQCSWIWNNKKNLQIL